jgi:uncharacterized caspase-like protein
MLERLTKFITGLALVFACSVGATASPALAEERVLVVASDYRSADNPSLALANPVHDGEKVSNAFRKAGQRDVVLVINPDVDDWNRELDRFVAKLGHDDVAIVFYAGHAVQYAGENYLLASDGNTFINFNSVVRKVNSAARAAVFMVDACRSNPFAGAEGAGRSVAISSLGGNESSREVSAVDASDLREAKAGLAQLSDLRGLSTVVFFSTEPGNVALDGEAGQGSPFASVLAKEVQKRQSLDSLLKRTASQVNQQTGGRQSPWRQGDIPFDIFFAGQRAFAIP